MLRETSPMRARLVMEKRMVLDLEDWFGGEFYFWGCGREIDE